MTAPRVEKLRQFIQDLDALHRQFTDEATLLDAVAEGARVGASLHEAAPADPLAVDAVTI